MSYQDLVKFLNSPAGLGLCAVVGAVLGMCLFVPMFDELARIRARREREKFWRQFGVSNFTDSEDRRDVGTGYMRRARSQAERRNQIRNQG